MNFVRFTNAVFLSLQKSSRFRTARNSSPDSFSFADTAVLQGRPHQLKAPALPQRAKITCLGKT